jgi:hypothetical protein
MSTPAPEPAPRTGPHERPREYGAPAAPDNAPDNAADAAAESGAGGGDVDGGDVFDLDAARIERQRLHAARREGRGATRTVRFGGRPIAVLGPEFPLDVLEPFANVNVDLALLIRNAINAARSEDQAEQLDTLDMIVSVLALNPNLPREVLEAVKQSGRRLLGDAGYEALVAGRPTPWDIGALIKNLMGWYGVSLGESSSSSTPSGGGRTSRPTSRTTIPDLTPAATGGPSATPSSGGSDTWPPASPASPTTP